MKYWLPLLFLQLFYCGFGDDLAGGTSTETTNGVIVVSSAGQVIPDAEVLVIDNDEWYANVSIGKSPVVDTLKSDSNGWISLKNLKISAYTLQIQNNKEAAIIKNPADTIVLQKGSCISGKAEGFSEIYVAGTALSATFTNDSFFIQNVPPGTYSLFAPIGDQLQMISRVQVDSATSIQIDNVNDTSLLFDDFMGGFDGNPLKAITREVHWFLYSDNQTGNYNNGNWKFDNYPALGNSNFMPSVSNGMVGIDGFLDSGFDGAYSGLGASLQADSTERGFDLSDLRSIRLKIRGSGIVMISLRTELTDSLSESTNYIAPYHVFLDLDTNFVDTTIQIESLKLDWEDMIYAIDAPWTSCANNVKTLQIGYRQKENIVDSSYWFQIDEIWFDGVKPPL